MLRRESALVVLVPEAEALIGSFRHCYDPGAALGMPAHVTILYPFKPPDAIDEDVLEALGRCFRRFNSFDFALTETRRFAGEVLYLAPIPEEPFRQLTLAAWDYSPNTPPYAGQFLKIVPHLTVAQSSDPDLDEIAREFEAASKLPIPARASEVTLMDTRSGRWEIAASFGLV